MAPNINHHVPPGQATEVSKAGRGGEAWWAGGWLSRSLPAGEGAEAGRACRQLSPGSGAHRGYVLIFRPEARRKRPFRSQQCWLPVFPRGRKPPQERVQAAQQGRSRPRAGVGAQCSPRAGNLQTPPLYGAFCSVSGRWLGPAVRGQC